MEFLNASGKFITDNLIWLGPTAAAGAAAVGFLIKTIFFKGGDQTDKTGISQNQSGGKFSRNIQIGSIKISKDDK